jgi:hypothetical protein
LSHSISDGVSILGAKEVAGFAFGEFVKAITEALAPPAFKFFSIAVSNRVQGLWVQSKFGRIAFAGQRGCANDLGAFRERVPAQVGERSTLADKIIYQNIIAPG